MVDDIPIEVIERVAGNDPILWILAVALFVVGLGLLGLFKLFYEQGERHRGEYSDLLRTTIVAMNAVNMSMDHISRELPRMASDLRSDMRDISSAIAHHRERARFYEDGQ